MTKAKTTGKKIYYVGIWEPGKPYPEGNNLVYGHTKGECLKKALEKMPWAQTDYQKHRVATCIQWQWA